MADPRALIAYLLFFPLAVLLLKKYHRAKGVAIVVLAGSCFLPEGVLLSLPGIPIIDKERVTYLAALLGIVLSYRTDFIKAKPGFGLELLLVLVFLANSATLAINQNIVVNDGAFQSALSIRWLFGQTIADFLTFALPYIVGRTMFRDMKDLEVLIRVIIGVGVVYFGLIVIEVLMSIPFRVFQFSHYVYGIDIAPRFRWGFNQPVVFMETGHALATFVVVAFLLAVGLRKTGDRGTWFGLKRVQPMLLTALIASFNVAGIVYGICLALLVKISRPRRILFAAACIAIFCCLYPALRLVDVFPDEQLVEIAMEYDRDRGRSLGGRFAEEDFILGSLGDRFWFGWGHFSRIPGASDFGWETGEAGLDAWWVIRTGMAGIVGTLLGYMFMSIPVLICWRRARRFQSESAMILVGVVMVCISIRMVDLLLNGWWNCLPVFLAGAVMGATRIQVPPDGYKKKQAPRRHSDVHSLVRRQNAFGRATHVKN